VYQEVSSLDQRLTELQSQLDRLSASLQQWREQQDHLKPAEDRLAEITRQCADVVTQWSSTGERQARAVDQLEERVSAFSAAEERLHNDAAERLRALERAIEQEWSALRQIHQPPLQELREQAAALGQVSVAAANSSVAGFERAEERLTEIERSLNQHLSGVSRQLEEAVAEIRALSPTRPQESAPSQAWPIEGVVRLHNQLRESADASGVINTTGTVVSTQAAPLALPPAPPQIAARLESIEQAIADRDTELRVAADEGRRTSRLVRVAVGVAAGVALLAVAGGWVLQEQASAAAAQAAQAQQEAQAAVAAANRQASAARDEAAKQMAEARENSARARVVGDVLASPDLVRFSVVGSGPAGIAGQVLWSRSRGVVFSGVRLPATPTRMTYQLWLLTDGAPVNAGTFAPDPTGRVTYTADAPQVSRAVIGAALTVEPAGGSEVPSDRLLVQNRTVRPVPVPAPADAPAPTAPQ
jgi:hypothetical protein